MKDFTKLAAYTEQFYIGRYVRDLTVEDTELIVHLDNAECFTVPCAQYRDLCRLVGEQDIAGLVRSINSDFESDFTTFIIERGATYHRTSK